MTARIDSLIRAREILDAKIEAALDRIPEPDLDGDTVVWFQAQFPYSQKVYTYVALKTPIGWFTTGQKDVHKFRTWDDMLDWFDENNVSVTSFWVVSQWTELS